MNTETTFDGTSLYHVLTNTERGMDLESGDDILWMPGQEDNVEGGVGHWLNNLEIKNKANMGME